MYIVTLINQKGETFNKTFYSGFYFDRFMNKAKRSNKLKVLAYERIN